MIKRIVERQMVKNSSLDAFDEWVKEEEDERGGFFDEKKGKKVRYYDQLSEEGKLEVKEQYQKERGEYIFKRYESLALKGNPSALKIVILKTKDFQKLKKPLSEIGKSKGFQFDVSKYEVDRDYQEGKPTTKYKLDFSSLTQQEKKVSGMGVSELKSSKASGIELKNISFQNVDLSWSNFSKSDIEYCNFKGANLIGSRFIKATLRSINFNDANLSLVDFQGVDFSSLGSVLPGLTKSNKLFDGADLKNTNFSGANLMNVDFSGVKDLPEKDFFYVDSKTKINLGTIPPKEVSLALRRIEAILLEIDEGVTNKLSESLKVLKNYKEFSLYVLFDTENKIEEGISKIENILSWKRHIPESLLSFSFSLSELKSFFVSTNGKVNSFIKEINKFLSLEGIDTKKTYLTEPINTTKITNRFKGRITYQGLLVGLPEGESSESSKYFLTVDMSDTGFFMGSKFYKADSYFFCLPKKNCSSRIKELDSRKAREIAIQIDARIPL